VGVGARMMKVVPYMESGGQAGVGGCYVTVS